MIMMQIELDTDEIDKVINCVKYTMDHFCEGPMWIEYKMIIESLEMQRERYNQPTTVAQALLLVVPQARKVDY